MTIYLHRLWDGRSDDRDSNLGWSREFFSTTPSPERLWVPPSLVTSGYRGHFSLGVMWLGCEADHSPPSSVLLVGDREFGMES